MNLNELSESKFWEKKSLHELNATEWEALCDCCGKCCVHKFIDDDSEKLIYTKVACKLLDLTTCLCKNYKRRVKGCLKLTKNDIEQFVWLPSTCAYRLLSEGKNLPTFHPLITKDLESVKSSGNSIIGKLISPKEAKGNYLDYEIEPF